jgi:hypothetical protein
VKRSPYEQPLLGCRRSPTADQRIAKLKRRVARLEKSRQEMATKPSFLVRLNEEKRLRKLEVEIGAPSRSVIASCSAKSPRGREGPPWFGPELDVTLGEAWERAQVRLWRDIADGVSPDPEWGPLGQE